MPAYGNADGQGYGEADGYDRFSLGEPENTRRPSVTFVSRKSQDDTVRTPCRPRAQHARTPRRAPVASGG